MQRLHRPLQVSSELALDAVLVGRVPTSGSAVDVANEDWYVESRNFR